MEEDTRRGPSNMKIEVRPEAHCYKYARKKSRFEWLSGMVVDQLAPGASDSCIRTGCGGYSLVKDISRVAQADRHAVCRRLTTGARVAA